MRAPRSSVTDEQVAKRQGAGLPVSIERLRLMIARGEKELAAMREALIRREALEAAKRP